MRRSGANPILLKIPNPNQKHLGQHRSTHPNPPSLFLSCLSPKWQVAPPIFSDLNKHKNETACLQACRVQLLCEDRCAPTREELRQATTPHQSKPREGGEGKWHGGDGDPGEEGAEWNSGLSSKGGSKLNCTVLVEMQFHTSCKDLLDIAEARFSKKLVFGFLIRSWCSLEKRKVTTPRI